MSTGAPDMGVVGRDRLLGRLLDVLALATDLGDRQTVLVAGEAGIGKTTLVRSALAVAEVAGARVGRGAGVDVDGVPAYWPWTQALNDLVRATGRDRARLVAGEDVGLLATIATALGDPAAGASTEGTRLLVWDAVGRWLDALGEGAPVVVALDDLQWADDSSLQLLDFLSRTPQRARVCLVGAYRHDELSTSARRRLDEVLGHAHHLRVDGLDAVAVRALVEQVTGRPVEQAAADAIHRRTAGHPLFARELALLTDADGERDDIPSAVHDAIDRKIRRLPADALAVLEVAALVGPEILPDVIAHATGATGVDVERAIRPAVLAGVLSTTTTRTRFAHDLVRESIRARLDPGRRAHLHRAIGGALEDRHARAGDVAPAEVAGHLTAAVALDGPERACRWALAAASADRAALAFVEAAGHLRRLRAAVADAGAVVEDHLLCAVLVAEADCLARAGSTTDARGLLRVARDVADRAGDAREVARVALATADLGARFAVRRDDVVGELERALERIAGADADLEALLAATLARELQHSVPEDRHRAGPLSERALALGRRSADPATLATCLLARHDLLWTPGRAEERAEVAREIIDVAQRIGDEERHAQGLLLLANALLEQGSGAFRGPAESSIAVLDRLGQPRHRYTAETRRACLALLRGDLAEAAERIDGAAALGRRIREPDTDNVRMSQQLELVLAGGDPEALRRFAVEAVAHWTGAPTHAHAVAAGFHARAGDLDAAGRHLASVMDLGGWQHDRSYLWSVYVRELAHAAIALGDAALCRQLLEDLEPIAGSCGVNGAVVAFAGSHAHTAGLLAAALGLADRAADLLLRARGTYARLGASRWEDAVSRLLAAEGATARTPAATASLRRRGPVWELSFAGRQATVPHIKGLADLAVLLAAPGREVHVLDLVGTPDRTGAAGQVVDRQALDAYRRRLVDLDEDLADADRDRDGERAARLAEERQALLDEVGRVTGVGGRRRDFASHPGERARKAVAGRIRDAIRKVDAVLPAMAAHLDASVVTGTYCRYRSDEALTWDVRPAEDAAQASPSA